MPAVIRGETVIGDPPSGVTSQITRYAYKKLWLSCGHQILVKWVKENPFSVPECPYCDGDYSEI